MCLDYPWIIWRKYTYIRILHNWIWLLCLSSGKKETNLFSVYWLYVQYSVMETSSWHWDIIPNAVVCFWHYLCAKFYSPINIKKWTQLELFKITGSQTSQTELLSDCQRKSVPVKTSQVALDICHSMLWPLIRFPFLRVSWWELEKSIRITTTRWQPGPTVSRIPDIIEIITVIPGRDRGETSYQ